MSITLSHETFVSLSKTCRDEILQAFATSNDPIQTIKGHLDVKDNTAFESARLTFGKPLILPKYNHDKNEATVKVASSYPIAKPTDLYSLAPLSVLHRICTDIDSSLFVSNLKSVSWSKGSKFHHMDWDVKRLVMEVKFLQPATSVQIDQALPNMDRYRVTAILRELRKQGILIVS